MILHLLSLLAGCAGDKAGGPADETPVTPGEPIYLSDANNYAYSGQIDVPATAVAEQTDVAFDWSALTRDMQCHALDPVADIDNLAILVFPDLAEADVEAGLSQDTLQQVDLGLYLNYLPGDATNAGGTVAALTQFTFFGTDPEILPELVAGSGTWMLLLTTGTTLAVGTRTLAFFTPTAGESNTDVAVGDSCGILDFDADLEGLDPVPVSTTGPWPIDWSALTVNGQGAALDAGKIDGLMIARYDDLTLAELQAQFLDLELIADGLWTMELEGGTTATLDGAADADSAPFPGFTTGGVWLLALRCSTCPNPAPLFLTAIEPQ